MTKLELLELKETLKQIQLLVDRAEALIVKEEASKGTGTPLESLVLKPQTRLILENKGIETVEELISYDQIHLLKTPGICTVTMREINRVLEENGLQLAKYIPRK